LVYTLDLSSPTNDNKDKPHECGVVSCPTDGLPSAGNGSRELTSTKWSVNTQHLKSPHTDWKALIDRGANGCIAGRDMKVIEVTERTIDLSEIDNHTVLNLRLEAFQGRSVCECDIWG
jgi:hypothetical protein